MNTAAIPDLTPRRLMAVLALVAVLAGTGVFILATRSHAYTSPGQQVETLIHADNTCNSGSASSRNSGVSPSEWGVTPNGGLPCKAYWTYPNGSNPQSYFFYQAVAPLRASSVDVQYYVPCNNADYPDVQWILTDTAGGVLGSSTFPKSSKLNESNTCNPSSVDLGQFPIVGGHTISLEINDVGDKNTTSHYENQILVGPFIGAGDTKMTFSWQN